MVGRASNRLNVIAGVASVSVAVSLVVAKVWAYGQTGALSVAASLADSGIDLLVSVTALGAIIYAARPPDADHAFGHSSAEDLAALGQSVVVVISGLAIGAAGLQRIFSSAPVALEAQGAGLAVMLVSIALSLALVTFQQWVTRRTGSKVVAADSLHYLSDLIPNAGAVAALIASQYFGVGWIDTLAALAASVVLLTGGCRIGKRAVDALMDRKAPDEVEAGIAAIAREHPGVLGFHDLKTRTAGTAIFVTLHVELDGALSLRNAHDIGASLRRRIMAAYPKADVTIHKDVWSPRPRDGGTRTEQAAQEAGP